MCTNYRLDGSLADIAATFGAKAEEGLQPTASAFPDSVAPVVRISGSGRTLCPARWGVPPPAAGKRPVVNIRNLDSPFWRAALAKPGLRCLVPATAFAEWTDQPDPETGRKVKHWFGRADRAPFAFAGLLRPVPGEDVPRFAFLTCAPDRLIAPVHAKAMPVVLSPADHAPWLDGAPAHAFQHPPAEGFLSHLG